MDFSRLINNPATGLGHFAVRRDSWFVHDGSPVGSPCGYSAEGTEMSHEVPARGCSIFLLMLETFA